MRWLAAGPREVKPDPLCEQVGDDQPWGCSMFTETCMGLSENTAHQKSTVLSSFFRLTSPFWEYISISPFFRQTHVKFAV